MRRLFPLLIWASLSIGGVASEGCFSNIVWPGLKVEPASGGWNGVGKGFLSMFTPDKLTDENWELIGKMKKNFEFADIKKFAMSMSGLVFLFVVSIILIVLFCAAPCALGVYFCTCKKKCKPKSNAIVTYTGIGCNSLAILTIFLSILFLFLAIGSLTSGIESVGTAFDPLPGVMDSLATTMKDQAKCTLKSPMENLTKILGGLPTMISGKISEIPELKAVMAIDFAAKVVKINEFAAKTDELSTEIQKTRAALATNPYAQFLNSPLSNLDETKRILGVIKSQLTAGSGGSIPDKLKDVETKRDAASPAKIEEKVRDKMKSSLDQIKKVSMDTNTKLEENFKQIDKYKAKVKSLVDDNVKKNVDKVKEHLGMATLLNLVLFPCYLALASAIWATCQSIKFVQKKKAKSKEKCGLLIPISIGFALAFIPLLCSFMFMMLSGISNVVCNSVFQDKSFGFVPQALTALNLDPSIEIRGTKVDIVTAIEECKNDKTLISIIKGESLLDENKVIKEFDIDAKKADMTAKFTTFSFDLPATTEFDGIQNQIATITKQRTDAKPQIDDLRTFDFADPVTPGAPRLVLVNVVPEVGALVASLDKFMREVELFEGDCDTDITSAKATVTALDENKLRGFMIGMMNTGDGTPANPGILKMMETQLNGGYLAIRTEFLTKSTNCGFLFAAWDDVGLIVCDQGASGLFGIYSAIGLGVFSFFSACVGTVLLWHSFRVGKGPQDQKKPSDEKSSDVNSKGKKKKKKGGEGGEEEGGEEEEVVNMAGKIGEQAEPMKQPASQPTPPGGLQLTITPPPGMPVQVVQAVPTDPAAPGEKTNPSLLPNDDMLAGAGGAGAGAAPDSGPPPPLPPVVVNMQMVNMEKPDQEEKSKQNSITGAGGETAGGGPGATQ